MLTPDQKKFISQRKKIVQWWPFAGIAVILILVCFIIVLFLKIPLLVNPYEVVERINNGTLGITTAKLLAVIGSVMFSVTFILLFLIIVIILKALNNEKRLIELIEEFNEQEISRLRGHLNDRT